MWFLPDVNKKPNLRGKEWWESYLYCKHADNKTINAIVYSKSHPYKEQAFIEYKKRIDEILRKRLYHEA
jgi:hypothetical protein